MNEIQNPAWPVVRQTLEDRLADARKRLENPSTEHSETQLLRGEIRALKRLLDLPEDLAAQQQQLAPPGWPAE